MNDLRSIFYRYPEELPLPMLLDGATGTQLIKRGRPEGVCIEKWVLEHREVMLDIQKSYVEAGSDAVLAPTFSSTRFGLEKFGLGDKVTEYNRELVALARESGAKYVGGDLSPSGKLIVPFGSASFEELVDIFCEQAQALEAEGVDFFTAETLMNLQEGRAIVTAIHRVSDKPVFVTFTVSPDGKTMFGDTMEAALLTMAELGISAFGCNCSFGPEDMLKVLQPIVPLAVSLGIPVIAKPNAGMPSLNKDGVMEYDLDAQGFGAFASQFLDSGVCVLGGCCGTDASHISALKGEMAKVRELPELKKTDTSRLICNNKTVAEFDGSVEKVYNADDDLTEIEDKYAVIRLETPEDAANLLVNAYTAPVPFVVTGDKKSIEIFRKEYAGKTIEI